MAFVNNYTSSEHTIREDEIYGPDPYDINCVIPVPTNLATPKLRLVPFIPRVHAATYLEGVRGNESMYKHMAHSIEHPSQFLRAIEGVRRDETGCLFAAIDTTRPDPDHPEWGGSLAGLFGLYEIVISRLTTEIGPAIVLPAFQRTHVASHAVGLLLKHVFELPPEGLGFRKAKWAASPFNEPSNKLAERMGFKLEGVVRWKYVLPVIEGYEKVGVDARVGDAGNGLRGRDSNEWSVCWDDWENGGREIVERAFAREV